MSMAVKIKSSLFFFFVLVSVQIAGMDKKILINEGPNGLCDGVRVKITGIDQRMSTRDNTVINKGPNGLCGRVSVVLTKRSNQSPETGNKCEYLKSLSKEADAFWLVHNMGKQSINNQGFELKGVKEILDKVERNDREEERIKINNLQKEVNELSSYIYSIGADLNLILNKIHGNGSEEKRIIPNNDAVITKKNIIALSVKQKQLKVSPINIIIINEVKRAVKKKKDFTMNERLPLKKRDNIIAQISKKRKAIEEPLIAEPLSNKTKRMKLMVKQHQIIAGDIYVEDVY